MTVGSQPELKPKVGHPTDFATQAPQQQMNFSKVAEGGRIKIIMIAKKEKTVIEFNIFSIKIHP